MELIAAPGLVELVEAGQTDSDQTRDLLEQVLGPYRGQLDGLVLGCTHYPFAKKAIRQVLGAQIPLFDGGPGTARQTVRCLENAGLMCRGTGSVVLESSRPGMEDLFASLLYSSE